MDQLKHTTFLLLTLALLAACSVPRQAAVPDAPLPAGYRSPSAATGTPAGELPWNEYFGDSTLQRLVDSALAHNYDVQLALKNTESARLALRQARLGYLPEAALQVSAGINRPSDNSLNGLSAKSFLGVTHVEDYTAALNLSWEADIWGKVKAQKAGALAAYLQTQEARKWVQTGIVSAVAQGYYNLLALDAQVAIARRNRDLSDSTLRIIRLQYNSGQVTALAVEQAEAQQLTATALLPRLEEAIALQENALHLLAGSVPGPVARSARLGDIPLADSLSAGVPAALLQQRPDIRAFALELERANAQVGVARAEMYPALRISASGGLNAFQASNWFNVPASLFGLAAGSIAQPVFQKRRLRTAWELAQVEREKAVVRFRQSVLGAVGEVSDALLRAGKLKEAEEAAARRAATLQKAVTDARLLFTTGMATYLEVLTAQANALQSELELATLHREQLDARVALYRALGGGWK